MRVSQNAYIPIKAINSYHDYNQLQIAVYFTKADGYRYKQSRYWMSVNPVVVTKKTSMAGTEYEEVLSFPLTHGVTHQLMFVDRNTKTNRRKAVEEAQKCLNGIVHQVCEDSRCIVVQEAVDAVKLEVSPVTGV